MDWFKGKSEPDNIDVEILKKYGAVQFQFPLNQSIEISYIPPSGN